MGFFKNIVLILVSFAVAPLFAKDNLTVSSEAAMPCQYLLQPTAVDGAARQARTRRLYHDIDSRDGYSTSGGIADDFSQERDAIDPGEF